MNTSEDQLGDDFCYSMGNLAESCLEMKKELGCETFDQCLAMMPELKEPQLSPGIFPLLVLLMLTTIVANLMVTFHNLKILNCEFDFLPTTQVIVTWFYQKQLQTPSNLHIVSLATVGEYQSFAIVRFTCLWRFHSFDLLGS